MINKFILAVSRRLTQKTLNSFNIAITNNPYEAVQDR